MSFIEEIKQRAKQDIKTIILPEAQDIRTLKATEQVLKEGYAKIILVGNKEEIEEKAKGLVKDPVYFGMLMLKDEKSEADGLVSGAIHSTADTLRPALQILKTAPDTKLVSAFFLMTVPDCILLMVVLNQNLQKR